MRGKQLITDNPNKQLTLELTSMDQYLAHSKMYEDWGMNKLHEKLAHEYDEELGHAKRLAERILFLEGLVDTASREPLKIGSNVKEMLANDLSAEHTVAASLKRIIVLCEQEQDFISREILEELLDDTESDHIYWLEQHMSLINKVGLQNYIQSQMG